MASETVYLIYFLGYRSQKTAPHFAKCDIFYFETPLKNKNSDQKMFKSLEYLK